MEALEEELESETDLMEYLVDAMGLLLKMHRAGVCVRFSFPFTLFVISCFPLTLWFVSGCAAFLPIFAKHVAPAFDPLLNIQAPATLLWSALCVFVDVVEVCEQFTLTSWIPFVVPLRCEYLCFMLTVVWS